MLGSALVGLDGTVHSEQAVNLAIRWGQQTGATVIGMTILDEPAICQGEAIPLGGAMFKEHRDQQRLSEAEEKLRGFSETFSKRCLAGGVPFQTRQETGIPWARLNQAAQEFDLVLLGSKTHFHFKTQDTPCETLYRIVKHAPRPVVAVPEQIPESNVTVVAFDGSLQAARALQVFEAVGLHPVQEVHVVTVDTNMEAAQLNAQKAANFLGYHKVKALTHPIVSHANPSDILLERVETLRAGLLVMGAYGEAFLREFFFGSATQRLLAQATVPVFVYH